MFNQKRFKQLRISEIVIAAMIPFLSASISIFSSVSSYGVIVLGFLGTVVVILTAVFALGKYQEHWIEYRTTCKSLKKEKHLYLSQVNPYEGTNAFSTLVQRIESLISKENTNWAQYLLREMKEVVDDQK